jgi:toxin-antitoxin system PIN domain toxin
VIYLLDVNALLALGYNKHLHHARAEEWLQSKGNDPDLALATCAITELGFVRIASGPAAHAADVATASGALAQLKANRSVEFLFLTDPLGADRLPAWVTKSAQTTDGHLLELAFEHNAKLATFDTQIPNAELIP